MKYDKIKMVSFRAESRVAGRSREILLIKKDFSISFTSFTSLACLQQAGE